MDGEGNPLDAISKTADATKAVAETTGKGIDLAMSFGKFLREIGGTIPEDLVGIGFGDWLRAKRIENAQEIYRKLEVKIGLNRIESSDEVPTAIAGELLEGATKENRDELQDLWVELLAKALSADTSKLVTLRVIQALKKMEPLDARCLTELRILGPGNPGNIRDPLSQKLAVSSDEVEVSLEHLYELGCVTLAGDPLRPTTFAPAFMTPFGREFLRAVDKG